MTRVTYAVHIADRFNNSNGNQESLQKKLIKKSSEVWRRLSASNNSSNHHKHKHIEINLLEPTS